MMEEKILKTLNGKGGRGMPGSPTDSPRDMSVRRASRKALAIGMQYQLIGRVSAHANVPTHICSWIPTRALNLSSAALHSKIPSAIWLANNRAQSWRSSPLIDHQLWR
jgi:hypothetical protein